MQLIKPKKKNKFTENLIIIELGIALIFLVYSTIAIPNKFWVYTSMIIFAVTLITYIKIIGFKLVKNKYVNFSVIIGVSLVMIFIADIRINEILFTTGVKPMSVNIEREHTELAKYFLTLNPEIYKSVRIINFRKSSILLFISEKFADETWGGFAFGYDRTVDVFMNNSYYYEGKSTVLHEVCHIIYFKDLNNEERKLWQIEFDKNITYFRDYSRNDIREDFADYCAEYLIFDVIKHNKIPPKNNLFEEYLKIFEKEAEGRKIILDNYFNKLNISSTFKNYE